MSRRKSSSQKSTVGDNKTKIIIATVSVVGAIIVAYLGYLGTTRAAETPIRATQMAEARLASIAAAVTPTSLPTATPSILPTHTSTSPIPTTPSTILPTNTPMTPATPTLEPTNTSDSCSGTLCFLDNPIDQSVAHPRRGVELDFVDSSLHITGRQADALAWLDDDNLPGNVRITIDFQTPDSICRFQVGFGNGISYAPNYHLTIDATGYIEFFRKRPATEEFEDGNSYYFLDSVPNLVFEANTIYHIKLERENGDVDISIDGKPLMRIPHTLEEMMDISQLDHLFISANTNNAEPGCTVIIEKLLVEEIAN